MTCPIRSALVGLGKICRDEHIPIISQSSRFQLAWLVSSRPQTEFGVSVHESLQAALEAHAGIDAVVICTTPGVSGHNWRKPRWVGCAVLLEKPPAADVATAENVGKGGESGP